MLLREFFANRRRSVAAAELNQLEVRRSKCKDVFGKKISVWPAGSSERRHGINVEPRRFDWVETRLGWCLGRVYVPSVSAHVPTVPSRRLYVFVVRQAQVQPLP